MDKEKKKRLFLIAVIIYALFALLLTECPFFSVYGTTFSLYELTKRMKDGIWLYLLIFVSQLVEVAWLIIKLGKYTISQNENVNIGPPLEIALLTIIFVLTLGDISAIGVLGLICGFCSVGIIIFLKYENVLKNIKEAKESNDKNDADESKNTDYKYKESENDKKENKQNPRVPYYCGKCFHEGPYEGNCPICNSSLKRYK